MPVGEHLDLLTSEIDACNALRLHALSGVMDAASRSLVYESILMRAFRCHENFLENVFLSYLLGESTESGDAVQTFVSPRDAVHARRMLSTSANARFLDWSEADTVRDRCSVFFESDSPIYVASIGLAAELSWLKKVRNHAAHNSIESGVQYSNVLRHVLLTAPTPTPPPGDFLQLTPRSGPMRNREVLAFFLAAIQEFANTASGSAPSGTGSSGTRSES